MKIPAKGAPRDELFETLQRYRDKDVDYKSGRVWGYVYDAGPEAEAVAKQAYNEFLSINCLDPTVYPSVLRLENEIVAMAAAHLNGDQDAVGNFTTGGTESIMLAVKAAREHAAATRPEVTEPEILLPVTAHAAFHKAAKYLKLKPVVVPVDKNSFTTDMAALEAAITDNTVLLVASATSYAHGVVDPVEQTAALAQARGIPCHVDGCIGGFLLPYYRRLGSDIPPFDFSVPGVTSISMDLHKYGYCAKGASVVMYRSKELRKHQFFACSLWPGYTVVNTTVLSTKSAGPLAAAWAVMNFLGDEGYLELARQTREASLALIEGINANPDLRVLGQPKMSLIGFASDTINVFRLCDAMNARGWYIQPQLGFAGGPENVHLTVTPSSLRWVEPLLADLRVAIEEIRGVGKSELARAIPQMFAQIDPASVNAETLGQMTQMAGISSTEIPEQMAEINEILDALPDEISEKLLIEYMNDLFTQPKD